MTGTKKDSSAFEQAEFAAALAREVERIDELLAVERATGEASLELLTARKVAVTAYQSARIEAERPRVLG